jgi:hypothetical protein
MIMPSKYVVLSALLALGQPVAAQALAVPPLSTDTITGRHPVLFKLGTGLTRGLQKQKTSLSLLAVPIAAGVEYQWRPDWTLYANGFGGVSMNMLEDEARPTGFLYASIVGGDLGGRHYYYKKAAHTGHSAATIWPGKPPPVGTAPPGTKRTPPTSTPRWRPFGGCSAAWAATACSMPIWGPACATRNGRLLLTALPVPSS